MQREYDNIPMQPKSVTLSTILSDLRTLNQRLVGISRTSDSVAEQLRGAYPKAKAEGTLVGPGNLIMAIEEELQIGFSWVSDIEGRLADVCDALGGSFSPDRDDKPASDH